MKSAARKQRRPKTDPGAYYALTTFWPPFRKSKAQPRPQVTVPEKGIGPIFEPNCNDVLKGRGGRINNHEGNIQFRDIVNATKQEYLSESTKKLDKAHIASGIVERIRTMDPPGRFLEEEGNTGQWFDIGDAKAIKKVLQALRENTSKDDDKKKDNSGTDGKKTDDKASDGAAAGAKKQSEKKPPEKKQKSLREDKGSPSRTKKKAPTAQQNLESSTAIAPLPILVDSSRDDSQKQRPDMYREQKSARGKKTPTYSQRAMDLAGPSNDFAFGRNFSPPVEIPVDTAATSEVSGLSGLSDPLMQGQKKAAQKAMIAHANNAFHQPAMPHMYQQGHQQQPPMMMAAQTMPQHMNMQMQPHHAMAHYPLVVQPMLQAPHAMAPPHLMAPPMTQQYMAQQMPQVAMMQHMQPPPQQQQQQQHPHHQMMQHGAYPSNMVQPAARNPDMEPIELTESLHTTASSNFDVLSNSIDSFFGYSHKRSNSESDLNSLMKMDAVSEDGFNRVNTGKEWADGVESIHTFGSSSLLGGRSKGGLTGSVVSKGDRSLVNPMSVTSMSITSFAGNSLATATSEMSEYFRALDLAMDTQSLQMDD